MPNNYYERFSEMNPGELADGLAIEQEFDAIGRGFAKLPEPHRDGRGFEGPTRVGEPVEEADAVNLGALEKLNLPIYRKQITTEDWNAITDAGIYDVVNARGANKAPGHQYGILNVYKFNGVVSQTYYPDNPSLSFIARRTCSDVSTQSWSSWDGSLPISKIIGPIDSGSIIERGSNANGEYVKFCDGTLMAMCNQINMSNINITSAAGSLFQTAGIISIPYPIQFVGMVRPYLLVTHSFGPIRAFPVAVDIRFDRIDFVMQAGASAIFSGQAMAGAIGRWK